MSNSTKPRVDDEDDVDDLDDVLDQFTPSKAPTSSLSQSTSPPAANEPTSSQASKPKPSTSTSDMGADFAKDLADEMESLWRGIAQQEEPNEGSGNEDETSEQREERERALAAAWEAMLIEGMDGMIDPSLTQGAPTVPKTAEKDDFQSRIRNTMNKLKESESGLKSSDTSSSTNSSDPLEALLSQFGGENEDELQGVLEAMMGQLMGKDVLYEPLKELSDKFPDYLKTHATALSSDDKNRYDAQIVCMKQLLDIFESKSYDDDNDKTRTKIVDLMGELQKHGSPPEEIMGPLPPGFNMGADGMPNMPDNCVIS